MSDSERDNGSPGSRQAPRGGDFDAMYVAGRPPWDIGGTGEHALMAAAIGLDATGVDAAAACSASAIMNPAGGARVVSSKRRSWRASHGWRVETIEPTTLEITIEPGSVRAWLASVVRV